jgi:hypothetical protein
MRKRGRVRDQDLIGVPHHLAAFFFLPEFVFSSPSLKIELPYLKQLVREEERHASLEGSSDKRRKKSSCANKGDIIRSHIRLLTPGSGVYLVSSVFGFGLVNAPTPLDF